MRTYKCNGKEEISMRSVFLLILVFLFFSVCPVQATDIDFYSDAIIKEGDMYGLVRIYDTPPETTTLDMFGGSINQLRTYDLSIVNIYEGEIIESIDRAGSIESYNSSMVNIYGGEISGSIETYNTSTLNIYGGIIRWDVLSVRNSSIVNIYGGNLTIHNSPIFHESITVNLYGYGFEYDDGTLTGFLSDGSSFIFRELFYEEYSLMNLIVVPEPISAIIEIQPKTLNLSSKGRWINCRIRFPEDCNVSDIKIDSVLFEGRVKADSILFNQQQQCANVKFSRSALSDFLEPGKVDLMVTGYLVNGTYFAGTDSIQVIDKGHK